MKRRTFLSAVGLGIAGTAGCSRLAGEQTPGGATSPGDASDENGDAGTDGGPSAEPGGTPSVDESFALRSVDAPETTELTEIFTFRLTLENVTARDRTFTSTFSVRRDGGDWTTSNIPLELPVPANTTTQWESPRLRLRYLGSVEFRLDALGETWTIEAVENNRDFDVPIGIPGGLDLVVEGVTFADSIGTEGGATATPRGDGRWLLASIGVLNRGSDPVEAPSPSEFTLRLDDRGTRSPADVTPERPYGGGTVEAGERLTGDVAFSVPRETTIHDVTVAWRRAYPNGEMVVSWDK